MSGYIMELLQKKRCIPEQVLQRMEASNLSDKASLVYLRTGDLLTREGDWVSNLYVLLQGVVRGYTVNENGREMTDRIIHTPGMTLMATVDRQKPAPVSLQALAESLVVSLPLADVRAAIERDILLMDYALSVMNRHLQEQRRFTMMRFLYATEERYRWFLEEYGDVAGLLNIRTIASFIGTTPETLSRIRTRNEMPRGRHRHQLEGLTRRRSGAVEEPLAREEQMARTVAQYEADAGERLREAAEPDSWADDWSARRAGRMHYAPRTEGSPAPAARAAESAAGAAAYAADTTTAGGRDAGGGGINSSTVQKEKNKER